MGKLYAENLDDVVEIIDQYILKFKEEHNPLGYFSAIYKLTTHKIISVIEACEELDEDGNRTEHHKKLQHSDPDAFHFDDAKRMRKMVIKFANRYFAALDGYLHEGADQKGITAPWEAAFAGSEHRGIKGLIVDQHFFLSALSHISLDLGIAASEVCEEEKIEIESFEKDFITVNEILSSLYPQVNNVIGLILPPVSKFLRFFSKLILIAEDKIMIKLRKQAWAFSLDIYNCKVRGVSPQVGEYGIQVSNSDLTPDERNEMYDDIINKKAEGIAKVSRRIIRLWWIFKPIIWWILINERYFRGIRISLFENSAYTLKPDDYFKKK